MQNNRANAHLKIGHFKEHSKNAMKCVKVGKVLTEVETC